MRQLQIENIKTEIEVTAKSLLIRFHRKSDFGVRKKKSDFIEDKQFVLFKACEIYISI